MLKKINKIAEALFVDRSTAIRGLVKDGLDRGRNILLLRSARGTRATDRTLGVAAAEMRAKAARSAVERAVPADKPAAEIKALHAEEHVEVLVSSEADRLALDRARKLKPAAVETDFGPPTEYRSRRPRGQFSADEVKAIADRAAARGKSKPTT